MESIRLIAGTVYNIIKNGIPFRFGVVPIVETEDGKKTQSNAMCMCIDFSSLCTGLKMARLLQYTIEKFGRGKAMNLLRKVGHLIRLNN